ncbi:MAG: tetratricopeptide repeat protein, partial [Crocinitomicaceae bacterium]|nr:tetratricopeptide repeat protein [Crocinitomicaceae bacterium]
MKTILFFLFFLPFFSFSQSAEFEKYISEGVKYYDSRNYDAAVQQYQKALKIDSKSELANYELALTYAAMKDYRAALSYCEVAIEANGKNILAAYLIKGSCLDELGQTEESIKLFEKGIKKFGYDHLLCYNLGMDYYRMGDLAKAQEIIEHGIETKKSHASSHMLLGYVLADQGMKVKSILALHYFLLLEPTSNRSE